jgi:hypothetical protein
LHYHPIRRAPTPSSQADKFSGSQDETIFAGIEKRPSS